MHLLAVGGDMFEQMSQQHSEGKKMCRRVTQRPVTDLAELLGKRARANVAEMQNTAFISVLRRVLNGNDIVLSATHSKPTILMRGTGRSSFISSTQMDARGSQTF